MSTAATGIFDRSTAGLVLPPTTVQVERGRVRFFSETIGEQNPIHRDVLAARAAGYPDLVAPPTFATVIDMIAGEEQRLQGHPSIMERINCDMQRLLHGDESYAYHGLIFAGDDLHYSVSVGAFAIKKGGLLELVTLHSRIEHAERGLLVTGVRTLLHRLD